MGRISAAEIASALRSAGFPEKDLTRMTAAALAESGGNPRAHNPNASTGDNSYGLWQINMLGGMGPERRQQFGLKSNEELFDPLVNARAAKSIYESQGPSAWSVIRSGAYKKHLTEAEQGIKGLGGNGSVMPRLATPQPAATNPMQTGKTDLVGELVNALAPGMFDLGGMTRRDERSSNPWLTALSAPRFANNRELPGIDGGFFSGWNRAARTPRAERMAGDAVLDSTLDIGKIIGGLFAPQPAAPSAVTAVPAVTQIARSSGGGGTKGIVDVGKLLQGAGLRVKEHPAFGGVGGHSNGSLHYKGLALDLTDWQDPGESQKSWLPRKKWTAQQYENVLKGTGAEVFGPHNDPRGHGTHIHLGLPSGSLSGDLAQQLVQIRQQALKQYPLRWAD